MFISGDFTKVTGSNNLGHRIHMIGLIHNK